MLRLTEPAEKQLKVAIESGEIGPSRLRVFIDHRCHCGKAHFSLALDGDPAATDTVFDAADLPCAAGRGADSAVPTTMAAGADSERRGWRGRSSLSDLPAGRSDGPR